jgi:hypothetical protein
VALNAARHQERKQNDLAVCAVTMIGARANKIIDKLHHATVGVLVVSTVYFGFEAVRATMAIQKYKYEQKVRHMGTKYCVSVK